MKKLYKVIELLESIEQPRYIHELEQARWLGKFKYLNPDYLIIIQSKATSGVYFKAELTGAGKQYVKELKGEIFRLS